MFHCTEIDVCVHRFGGGVNCLDDHRAACLIAPCHCKETLRRGDRFIMDQFPIEITSDASAFQRDFDVIPSVCFDRTRHVRTDAALTEFNCMLGVPPTANIPPVPFLTLSGKTN